MRTWLRQPDKHLVFSFIILVACFTASLFWGRYPTLGFLSLRTLGEDPMAKSLLVYIRLPRTLLALLLGIALGAARNVFQMIFANPLVEPGFLGVSQGAAFGAAIGVLFLGNLVWSVQICAIIFAFCGLGLSYYFARRIRFGGWILRLLLAGIAVSAMFSAGVGMLKYYADPMSELPELTFWLLGGLWGGNWQKFLYILPVVFAGSMFLFLFRWRLNILSLNDLIAFSLGIVPGRSRMLFLTCAVGITAVVISISGIVGWVGLIVPHFARKFYGSDTRYSVPGAMISGGIFVTVCDLIARTVSPGELPLGVLTSIGGALLFLVYMTRRNGGIKK